MSEEKKQVLIEKHKLQLLINEAKEGREAKQKLATMAEGINFILGNNEEARSARQILMLMPTMDDESLKAVASPKVLQILTDFGQIFKEYFNGTA
jgi:hypothetical protein